jgi:hypothetical protein
MLQFIVPDLLEHSFAKSILRSFGILKIKFSLSRLVIESHLQGVQTVFLVHHYSSLPYRSNVAHFYILPQFLLSIKKSVDGFTL